MRALHKIVEGGSLAREEAREAMREIMRGEATPAQIAGLLVALRMKGEAPEEIAGLAEAMREGAVKVRTQRGPLLDTCGTGGDGAGTFNVSTLAAIVCASCGAAVAKHGNRSVSSKCGSADLMEALGVNLDLDADALGRCLDEVGLAFLFAPKLHPAMKHAMGPRRELGMRTVFNVLGPLTNPAGARRQLLGVFSAELAPKLARVLALLGAERAWVVHSRDGLDEISLAAPTFVAEVGESGEVGTFEVRPEELGIRRGRFEDMLGGGLEENVEIAREVLSGRPSPQRDWVALNAGAALYVAGLCSTPREGVEMALSALESGRARAKLEELVEFTQREASRRGEGGADA